MALDEMQRAIQVPARFLVYRNPIRAGVGERRNKFVRILDHQVTIERQFRRLAQRFHNRRTNGEVGDEVSIHDVHMNDTTAAFACGAHLLTKAGKISRKNRRCQFDQALSLETFLLKLFLLKPGLS
jgi:hypothetical protein